MNLYEKNGNILYILNVLKKYSNPEHILSSKKISELVKDEYNVDIDSRTVRRNIKLLIEKFNYDIEDYSVNHKGYFINRDPESEFEDGELSAILNTFAYSNFIPLKMSEEIVKKCLNMMNIYERDKYEDYKATIRNTKTDNYEIIKNIEDINEAIYHKNKITFYLYKYELDSDGLRKKQKRKVKTSPYRLVYALQKFYLICLDDGEKQLFSYRLDRMKDINILNRNVTDIDIKEIDSFIENNVNMLSGVLEKVEIECDMSLLDTVIETYGKDIVLKRINKDRFYASFNTTIKGFRYWCLRNIEMVKIISPESLNENIMNTLREIYDGSRKNKRGTKKI